jgi:rubrerythrin
MQNDEIYNTFTTFITDERYRKYFLTNIDNWYQELDKIKVYENENLKLPSMHNKNADIKKMGIWLGAQKQNYKKRIHIMQNDEIYNAFTTFINDERYRKYFTSNEANWLERLDQIKVYENENLKLPSAYDENADIKAMGQWLCNQKENYKKRSQIMKNDEIYNAFTTFINDESYRKYFIGNQTNWLESLNQVQVYVNENLKLPSSKSKNAEIKKMGQWLGDQKKNYKKRINIMQNDEIYDAFTTFINDESYRKYFTSNETNWLESLNQVQVYVNENLKLPSAYDENTDIKKMGRWLGDQKQNYKKRSHIMQNDEIYNAFTAFITDERYKRYFIKINVISL